VQLCRGRPNGQRKPIAVRDRANGECLPSSTRFIAMHFEMCGEVILARNAGERGRRPVTWARLWIGTLHAVSLKKATRSIVRHGRQPCNSAARGECPPCSDASRSPGCTRPRRLAIDGSACLSKRIHRPQPPVQLVPTRENAARLIGGQLAAGQQPALLDERGLRTRTLDAACQHPWRPREFPRTPKRQREPVRAIPAASKMPPPIGSNLEDF